MHCARLKRVEMCKRLWLGVISGLILLVETFSCLADPYPDEIIGAWGGRAAFFGDDNAAQAQKACDSFRNPNLQELGGDVFVFVGNKKFSYGGYMDYVDDNVTVKQIGNNDWLVIDRHYDDGEGGKKPGNKNVNYEVKLSHNLLTIQEGKETSRFSRCNTQAQTPPANISEWKNQLVSLLTERKSYPSDARRLHQSGLVVLNVVVSRDGRLIDSQIKQSSGFILLDREAFDLLNRVEPFSPLPAEYSESKISLFIPIRFSLEGAPPTSAAVKPSENGAGQVVPPLAAAEAECVLAIPGSGFVANGRKFIITREAFNRDDDMEGRIKQLLGSQATLADWQTLKRLLSTKAQLAKFIDDVGLSKQSGNESCDNFLVANGGQFRLANGFWTFLTRHDGKVPNNYSALDSIGNHTLDLGRWSYKSQALVVISDSVPSVATFNDTRRDMSSSKVLRTTSIPSTAISEPKEELLKAVMREFYGAFSQTKGCWITKRNDETDCMKPYKLDIVGSDNNRRLFIVIAGQRLNDDGTPEESHPDTGILGLIVLSASGAQLGIIATNSLYEDFGSFGTVPPADSFTVHELGPNASYGWVIQDEHGDHGEEFDTNNLYAVVGETVTSIGSIPSRDYANGAGSGCEKGCANYSIELLIDSTAQNVPFYPLILRASGIKEGQPFNKTYRVPFDSSSFKYLVPRELE